MKPEKLYPLAFALAILIAIGFVVKWRKARHKDVEETYKVHKLVPDDFRVADVERAQFYRGTDPAQGVTLSRKRDDKGEPVGWKVDSRFDAPGDTKKIEDFLGDIRDKEGEFRSAKADVLGDYELTDEKAIHVAVYRKDAQEPWIHLLVGKTEGWQGGFVRLAGKDDVYTLNANLRSSLGFWGEEKDKQPESTEWLSKVVLDLDRDKIAKVELTYPDKKVALEKKTIAKPTDDKAPEEGEEKPPAATETKWEVAAGGPLVAPDGKVAALTDYGSSTVLNALDTFRCTDVVDPTKKSEWGLEQPAYRCEATMDDGKKHVLIAGRPEPGGEAYVVLEGTDRPVFKVERYLFDNLFKHGGELFQMKGLGLKEEEIGRVRVKLASGALTFTRPQDETQKGWSLAEPALQPAPAVHNDKVDSLIQRFAHWTPTDYADADVASGLDQPEAVLELATKQGKTYVLTLGAASRTIAGRYASLTDPDVPAGKYSPVVVTSSDAALVLAPLGSYLDLKALGVEAGALAKITVTRADKGFVLARKVADGQASGPWLLQTPEGEKETDFGKVETLASTLATMTGTDIRFGSDGAAPPLPATAFTLAVEAANGQSWEFAFGTEQEGRVSAVMGGRPYALVFPAGTANDVAPDPATLLKPEEPKSEPPKKDEGKTEEKKEEGDKEEGTGDGKAEEPKDDGKGGEGEKE